MADQQGVHIIQNLKQRWVAYQWLVHGLLALAVALLLGHVLYKFIALPFWWMPVFFAVALAALVIRRNPRLINEHYVARFLNQQYPELEESSNLLLQPTTQLNLLEQLQLHKVESALQTLPHKPGPLAKPLRNALIFFVIAAVLSMAVTHMHLPHSGVYARVFGHTSAQNHTPPEKVLPQIDGVSISITPPAYTGKLSRRQDKFTLMVEEGSTVRWHLTTNVSVKKLMLVLNGKTSLPLSYANNEHTQWNAQTVTTASGFYQVNIDGKLSDLYQIQTIKDNAPVIKIKTPKQYTYIDAGETPKVTMTAQVNDDYGVANALLVATVAKGSGESVKFKEYKMPFVLAAGHKQQYNLQKLFDLPALNMEPGDELYFYLQAQDTHQQQTRTDVYIISIQDTAALLDISGLAAANNIKPEYFRSERQIILDTEGLLKGRDSLSKDQFNEKSNEIATDQKLLRLRYGKFIGDENEDASADNGGGELAKPENFSDAGKIQQSFLEKDEDNDDAGFTEPAQKAQLRATLDEMWKAELQLRLHKPEAALPFEYKALRLLKDLQQKSRAYVAKTAYNPPPLKPEKRLSGDLSKIGSPVDQQTGKPLTEQAADLKKTVAVLEQARHTGILGSMDKRQLQLINAQLNSRAASQPVVYLPAVSALHRLLTEKPAQAADLLRVEGAVQRMLPPAKNLPHSTASATDMGLSQGYYQNLNHLNR